MSIDPSLKLKNALVRHRNVLTRAERIDVLKDEERWSEGDSGHGSAEGRSPQEHGRQEGQGRGRSRRQKEPLPAPPLRLPAAAAAPAKGGAKAGK